MSIPPRRSRSLAPFRPAGFEDVEDRLFLSANPLGDFFLSDSERLDPEWNYGEVAPALVEANRLTGVDYVRDQYGFQGHGQTVAVIDTGIAYDHVALGAGFGPGYRVVGGWDFTEENDANPYDDGPAGYHGTHVAGIIGSDDDVYTGVAPGVDLVALRVFNDQGVGSLSWVEDALEWVHENRNAFENPITTVNLSLGTSWNSDVPPSWAMLEDEFQQLRNDGIFIAVAAGNSFSSYHAPGLSYPAASPFVVPVASVGDTGQMSSFSQRNWRVLAAPGENIASTVPDHVFGADGSPNDWGVASGTSMASPYAAGASVLVREAMEFVGRADATQDAIYAHLYNTADVIYDAATAANYRRINLQAAIDALMPADDYGSDFAAAFGLGTLVHTQSVSGLIGRLDDEDVFRFTAAQTGLVHMTTTASHELIVACGLCGAHVQLTGGSFSFQVSAGQTYTLSLQTAAGLGYYDLALELAPAMTNWGVVEFDRFDGQRLSGGESWFQLAASREGLLTVESFFSRAAGDVDLELYDEDGRLVASSRCAADHERLDVFAEAGETFYLRAVGVNADVDFRLTNLVAVDGVMADVFGTCGNDEFTFAAGDVQRISVNDVEYEFSRSEATIFRFHGGAGADSIVLIGGEVDETAELRVGAAVLTSADYQARADSVENVRVYARNGNDVAYVYDSPGDDRFIVHPAWTLMEGDGFSNYTGQFEHVYGYARAGGNDSAYLYDSSGDDRFIAYPEWALMDGRGFSNYARQFERVYGYASCGGNDIAHLFDSSGDDRFIAYPEWALMDGRGFSNYARQFECVHGYAYRGGSDIAHLFDSSGDDRFIAGPEWAVLDGDGFSNCARQFERVYGYADGGSDVAHLYDSTGDDCLIAGPEWAVLDGDGFSNCARQFERVYGHAAAGGSDAAHLYDSTADDRFVAYPTWALLDGDGFANYVEQFERVCGYAAAGGSDAAYLHDSTGNDRFVAYPTWALLEGDGFANYAQKFERVYGYAAAGGSDAAYLHDSTEDDRFLAYPQWACMQGAGFSNYAWDFEDVNACANAGGEDRAVIGDVGGSDLLSGRGDSAILRRLACSARLSGFTFVTAQARAGERPRADVIAADFIFERLGDWRD